MPVKRELWKEKILETGCPEGWHCPRCSGGYLKLVAESLRFVKSGGTLHAEGEIWFEAEHAVLRFSALFECHNDKCRESVAVCGTGGYDEDVNEDGQLEWECYFRPQYIHPPLHFIPLSDAIPQKVRDPLASSFGLIWASPSAAANQVRIAIEDLLTELRIPRSRRTNRGKIARLTLHQRIELFKAIEPKLGEALLAVKWVGNVGSHFGELSRDDVFDAYDMLESALEELYGQHRKATQKLIRIINKRKGPRKKKRATSLI